MIKSIAIIGAGPAGCALACFLVERGLECVVFDDTKKPSLLVGESLIPAAVPILQRLGIEDEVARFSLIKEGAALRHASGEPRVDFAFQRLGRTAPNYAYNIPRPEFDNLLRARAATLGARFVEHRAKVIATKDNPKRDIQLSDESLAAAGLNDRQHPDLLIDATGRKRLFSRLLDIDAVRGPRNDVAHFAHFENYSSDSALPGQIVISILECGWSWQIPLPGRTSAGIVLSKDAASHYGKTAEERLQNVMRQNSILNKPDAHRVSDVMTYSNYQLVSKQGFGNGWVLLGDALGFVDPMLSPGVFMSLESASLLDRLLFKPQDLSPAQQQRQLDTYVYNVHRWHQAWSVLIEYFYDGRLLQLGEMRPEIDENTPRFSFGKIADVFIGRILSQLVSGVGTRSGLNQKSLFHTCRFMSQDAEKRDRYAIKSTLGPSSQPTSPNLSDTSEEIAA